MNFGWDCPPGHQCIFPMLQDWRQCPGGTYSSTENDNAGTWSETANVGVFACEPCPEQYHCLLRGDDKVVTATGYWSPLNMHIPLPTRAGTAANGVGSPLDFCKPGFHSDDFAGACSQCIAGEVCNFPSNRPLPCNEGRESTSTGQFTCEPCLIDEVFDSATQSCKTMAVNYRGKFALHGMFDPEKCPYGTYSDDTTLTGSGWARGDCQYLDQGYTCGSACNSP